MKLNKIMTCVSVLIALLIPVVAVGAYPPAGWHLEVTAVRHVDYTQNYWEVFQHGPVNQVVIAASKPPSLPNFQGMTVSLEVPKFGTANYPYVEPGPLQRTVLLGLFPLTQPVKEVSCTVRYKGWLAASHLVQGTPKKPEKLDETTRQACLKPDSDLDFEDPAFQRFLDSNGLRWHKDIHPLWFALRVLHYQQAHYSFGGPFITHLTDILSTREAECGTSAQFFVGTLRANGIPARLLIGLHTADGGPHCIAMFWADEMGWVPVDPSAFVKFKEVADEDHFGSDGSLIIVEEETNLSFGWYWLIKGQPAKQEFHISGTQLPLVVGLDLDRRLTQCNITPEGKWQQLTP